jgi:phospholipase C
MTIASLLLPIAMPSALAGAQAADESGQQANQQENPIVTTQPQSSADSDMQRYFSDPAAEPYLSREALVKLLQKRIKYVFVIINGSHSFDNEFGTFPGVNGLYSDGENPRSAADTSGFTQTFTDLTSGQTITVQPFGIGPAENSAAAENTDDSLAESDGPANNADGTQCAHLVMSHIDCDTIPFSWRWANRFTIFDNIFATEDTPPTSRAIATIDGQSEKGCVESTDAEGAESRASCISGYQGPQNLGNLTDNASQDGGVFYIGGGSANERPRVMTNPFAQMTENECYDYPVYTDIQSSEARAAHLINTIAADPTLWSQSAIIIMNDGSGGFYDHVPPPVLADGPETSPLSGGIRVPLILISPYARTGAVSHAEGDYNSIIGTIHDIFGMPASSGSPDDAEAFSNGTSPASGQPGLEGGNPESGGINSPIADSLLSGFDPLRLMGILPPLPASFATIPDSVVNTLPYYGGHGCEAVGIKPEDVRQGIVDNIPSGFNPPSLQGPATE